MDKEFAIPISIFLVTAGLFLVFSTPSVSQIANIAPANAADVGVPKVAGMIAQINETKINETVLDLQNFVTRAYGKAGNAEAATYLYDRLVAISPRLTVQYQGSYSNVIATLPGQDSATYIVGAHYDSTSSNLDNAPGATDNAAGCAIVLETARILSKYHFNHTLVFAFWNREENGQLGSNDFVAHALPADTELYFNFDSAALITATRLDVIYDASSAAIASLLDEYNGLYDINLALEHNAHTCSSDHLPFRNAGKKTIFTHQQVYAGSPTPNNGADHAHQHSTTDTIQYVSTTFAKKNGQLGMSVVATLAEPLVDEAYLGVRGAHDEIYYRIYNSTETSWEGWKVIPYGATCDSPATAVYNEKMYFVVRGMDAQSLWFGSVDLADYGFSGWTRLSGASPSTPALCCYGSKLVLVVRGFTNTIYHRSYDCISETWTEWVPVPEGATYDAPAAALLGDTLQLVVRGVNYDQIWHGYVNVTDNTFGGWTLLSGATPSAPTLVTNGAFLELVVRGESNIIWYCNYDITTKIWGDWTALPNGATFDVPGAAFMDNLIQIVVRGVNEDQIWHCYVNLSDSAFSGWTLLDGTTPSGPTLTN